MVADEKFDASADAVGVISMATNLEADDADELLIKPNGTSSTSRASLLVRMMG